MFFFSEFGNPKMYHHAILTVGENNGLGRLVFLQILLECRTKETKFVMVNVTKVSEDNDSVETVTTNSRSFKNQLFRELVNPVMPLTKECFQRLLNSRHRMYMRHIICPNSAPSCAYVPFPSSIFLPQGAR